MDAVYLAFIGLVDLDRTGNAPLPAKLVDVCDERGFHVAHPRRLAIL